MENTCHEPHNQNIPSEIQEENLNQVKIFVINLEKSVDRLAKFSAQMNEAGVKFEVFNATHGYDVHFKNLENNQEFTGLDLKNKIAKIGINVMYNVTCNPYDPNPTSFKFLGTSFRNTQQTASAGEIGLWCSNVRLWKESIEKGYNKVLVFEDDIALKNTTSFKQNLHNFESNVPESFDLAYISPVQYLGSKVGLKNNPYVSKFSPYSATWGAWSLLFSLKGMQKLLSQDYYKQAFDNFFWSITDRTEAAETNSPDSSFLEVYIASEHFIEQDHHSSNSLLCEMGRGPIGCY